MPTTTTQNDQRAVIMNKVTDLIAEVDKLGKMEGTPSDALLSKDEQISTSIKTLLHVVHTLTFALGLKGGK